MKKRKKTDISAEIKQIKRLFLWAVVMALICAALAISVLFYYFVPRDRDTYILTVPAFVGLEQEDIGVCDGVEVTREWIYSDEVACGTVISQIPYAGARRKVHIGEVCPVTVYISLGEKTQRVPAIIGLDQLSAAAALRSIGVKVRSVAIYGDGEDGTVIDTSPRVDFEIKSGDTVTLFVSRRRVESPVNVPSFIGMEKSEAVRRALSLGLFIGYIEDFGKGSSVFAQSIPEGASVLRGSYISFKAGREGDVGERPWPPIAAN